jgi:hypothetical protein
VALRLNASRSTRLRLLGAGAVAPYLPGAVNLTPWTVLTSYSGTAGAIGVTNSNDVLYSFWMRTVMIDTVTSKSHTGTFSYNSINGSSGIFVNPGTATLDATVASAEGVSGGVMFLDNASGNIGTVRLAFGDINSTQATSLTGGHFYQGIKSAGYASSYGEWRQVVVAASLGYGAGLKRLALYMAAPGQPLTNQNIVATTSVYSANWNTFNLNSAFGFAINWYQTNGFLTLGVAQMFVKLGVATIDGADVISAADGSGYCTINAGLLARLNNIKPVDFGADGSNVFAGYTLTGNYTNGAKPDIYHVGDKSTFLTNRGTATAYTALTLRTAVTAIPTTNIPFSNDGRGPGADNSIPDYAWHVSNTNQHVAQWVASSTVLAGQWASAGSTAGTSNVYKYTVGGTVGGTAPTDTTGTPFADGAATAVYMGKYKQAFPIMGLTGARTGQQMLCVIHTTDASGSLANAQRTLALSGWTAVVASDSWDDGTAYGVNYAVFTKTYATGDESASWLATCIPTTGISAVNIHWNMFGYNYINATTPVQASAVAKRTKTQVVAAGLAGVSAGLTTTRANTPVLSMLLGYSQSTVGPNITPPAGADLRYATKDGGTATITASESLQVAAGAFPGQSFACSNAIGRPCVMIDIALNPL